MEDFGIFTLLGDGFDVTNNNHNPSDCDCIPSDCIGHCQCDCIPSDCIGHCECD